LDSTCTHIAAQGPAKAKFFCKNQLKFHLQKEKKGAPGGRGQGLAIEKRTKKSVRTATGNLTFPSAEKGTRQKKE